MPPLPDHFVERPEYQQALKKELLNQGSKVGTLVVSAIYGLGGIGKSVLASKLAYAPDIQARFCDGILWATLGQNPDILPLLSGWIQALGDYDYKPTAIESASNQLRTLLYDKNVLLVVDDVWNPEHLKPFRIGGDGCCVLVTTREARIPNAHRYDLDVMTPDQALELMTQKLSEPLSDRARQYAIIFADRVGYLPLALELAASQIDEGVPWEELLEDFQAEIVRLETLDLYSQDEMPDDAKRRNYSLLACFNLSLQQLSPEQLQQFAWLGVIPEDVSLTQAMAETLWQVTARQAGSILRTFRAKALVLQGTKQADDRPSYRMHDLMHDLAGRLLTSPPQPVRDGKLPGLGLTKEDAHLELLNRYRAKTSNDQWHTLTDDGYIYAHLTWHMEQAKQPEEIHRLLQESNEQERNGWYEACDAIGKPTRFINDLGRAWRLAVEGYKNEPGATVALLYRYTLIRGSLNSLANHLAVEVVAALVDKDIWQISQGLAYAQQVQNPWQRAECISAILPYITRAILPGTIAIIGQLNNASHRSLVLSKLAQRFPEVWPDVLEAIRQIHYQYNGSRTKTKGFYKKALAIQEIAPHLPEQLLSNLLEISRSIPDNSDRAIALVAIAFRLSEIWPEAVTAIHNIQTTSYRVTADRARAFVDTAQHLPELWPEALNAIRDTQSMFTPSDIPIDTIPKLPKALWPEVLEIIRKLTYEHRRTSALIAMAQHLPELWDEVFITARQIKGFIYKSDIVVEMAPKLTKELLPGALSVVNDI